MPPIGQRQKAAPFLKRTESRRILSVGLVDVPGAHRLGTTFAAPSLRPFERIDYIFSTPGIESLAATLPQRMASDHLPVEARGRMP